MSREKKTTDDQTDRLKVWIIRRYEARGKFSQLEADSLIKSTRWKDMFYGRQNATEEMLKFVESVSVAEHNWIVTGLRDEDGELFFGTEIPRKHECETITSRMNWVIKEWAALKGRSLFEYLEKVSGLVNEKISADEWASVVLGRSKATTNMLKVVCSKRPHFCVWMLTGGSHGQGSDHVNPSSKESIILWKKMDESRHKRERLELEERIKTGRIKL